MAFKSDAHRRWWFANHGPNSGGGGSSGGGGEGGGGAAPVDRDAGYRAYMAAPERREERLQYAQAMYPGLSEADALRRLNDRNG